MAGRMSAASAPVTLTDRSEWQMSPLTDRDYDELTEWARAHVVDVARRSIELMPECSNHDAETIYRVALSKALETTWSSEEGKQLFMTPFGVCRLFWQSIKKRHPNAQESNLRPLFYVAGNITRVMDLFFDINNRAPADENPTGPVAAPAP